MDFARNRLCFGIILLVKLFFSIPAYGDWNAVFYEDSCLLFKALDAFQEPDIRYEVHLRRFQEFRNAVESNQDLTKKLTNLSHWDKFNYFSNSFVLKKRPKNNINELYFWEISFIFSLSEYVTPSFPFAFLNKHIYIVQPVETFKIGSWITSPPYNDVRRVSLRDYFRAHILAFILGASDLSGKNIGITPQKNIRFFDNENLFTWDLVPSKSNKSFFASFVSVAFDWPQYRIKLDRRLASELVQLIASLEKKKEDLLVYSKIRNLPDKIVSGIFERIDLLHSFDFSAGATFSDFVHFLYPRLAEGLPELNRLVSRILGRSVDDGVSLFFITRLIKFKNLSQRDQKLLDSWIGRYVL